ncbi:MAG: hypothetical protein VW239_00270 [Candidatus Nanopelagicales bacterium]
MKHASWKPWDPRTIYSERELAEMGYELPLYLVDPGAADPVLEAAREIKAREQRWRQAIQDARA